MLSTVIVKKPTNVTLTGGLVTPRAGENQSNDIHRSSLRFEDTALDIFTSGAEADIGIANAWSIGLWLRPEVLTDSQIPFATRNDTDGTNSIFFQILNSNIFRIVNTSSTITTIKDFRFVAVPSGGIRRWVYWLATWDGTDLIGYEGGAAKTPTSKVTDDAGTMTNTNTVIKLGGNTTVGTFAGRIHQLQIWNSVLGANEVASLYNNGVGSVIDASRNFGDYSSSANLVHWYRLGKIATFIGMGKDFKGNLDLS